MAREIVLVRHGETEWSRTHKHTGLSDIPLTEQGEDDARRLRTMMGRRDFAQVWSSPLQRARRTAELAGFADRIVVHDDLVEWDYGEHEGTVTAEMRERSPAWTVWTHPIGEGETVEAVGARADRVLDRIRATEGDLAVFAHGHFLRILAARWIHLPPVAGRHFRASAASISVLGFERETPVIVRWNQTHHLEARSAGLLRSLRSLASERRWRSFR